VAHRVLDHTADTGIEAEADSLSGLLEELAVAMFELIAPTPRTAARRWMEVTVRATAEEDLVVDVLSELLYLSEVADLIFCDFRMTTSADAGSVIIEAGGVPAEEVDSTGPPIKAVTYHGLVVRERSERWYARVYLDV
jgi:SHS2 domain-containing protein